MKPIQDAWDHLKEFTDSVLVRYNKEIEDHALVRERLERIQEESREMVARLKRLEAEEERRSYVNKLEMSQAAKRRAYWLRNVDFDSLSKRYATEFGLELTYKSEDWVLFSDWLVRESDPYERHAVIRNYNWDWGLDVPRWIIRQADTQLATVIAIFWFLEPGYFVSTIAEGQTEPEDMTEGYELLLEIRDKTLSGFYVEEPIESRIAYDGRPSMSWKGKDADLIALKQAEQSLIPTAAYEPILGEIPHSAAGLDSTCPVDMEGLG